MSVALNLKLFPFWIYSKFVRWMKEFGIEDVWVFSPLKPSFLMFQLLFLCHCHPQPLSIFPDFYRCCIYLILTFVCVKCVVFLPLSQSNKRAIKMSMACGILFANFTQVPFFILPNECCFCGLAKKTIFLLRKIEYLPFAGKISFDSLYVMGTWAPRAHFLIFLRRCKYRRCFIFLAFAFNECGSFFSPQLFSS